MYGMKTFFITVQLGSEIKNWFYGDFYRLAKENSDIRLVVFTHPITIEAYRKDFGHERCIFEVFPDLKLSNRPLRQFFRIVSQASIPTDVVSFRIWYWYKTGGSFLYFIVKQGVWLLSHLWIWRAFLRFVEYNFFRDERAWESSFQKYKPDAVFATTTYRDYDTTLLKYARRHGIPSVGMLRGWDNMSSKAFLLVHPDILCVQNNVMVDEAKNWNDLPPNRVKVVGFPYFDHYVDSAWRMTREEIGEAIGADPSKKWIGFFVGGIFVGFLRAGDGSYHAGLLDDAAARGEFGDALILASIHPGFRGEWGFSTDGTKVQQIRLTTQWNFSQNSMKVIMNLMRECEVAVDFGSSLSLETAIFDRPTVFVGFNGPDDSTVPWYKKISVAYDRYTHLRYIFDAGGGWIAKDPGELISAIKTYLIEQSLHREGRAQIVKNLVGPLDGKAGARVFQVLCTLGDKPIHD